MLAVRRVSSNPPHATTAPVQRFSRRTGARLSPDEYNAQWSVSAIAAAIKAPAMMMAAACWFTCAYAVDLNHAHHPGSRGSRTQVFDEGSAVGRRSSENGDAGEARQEFAKELNAFTSNFSIQASANGCGGDADTSPPTSVNFAACSAPGIDQERVGPLLR
jgi:hypothetical protein